MGRAFAVALPLFLAGCGLPPAVTIISYALDGISFFSTGKTVSDHALSAVAQKDCAVWRVIKGDLICHEYKEGERSIVVALAEQWQESTTEADPENLYDDEAPVIAAVPAVEVPAQTAETADPVMVPPSMSDLLPALDGVAAVGEPPDSGAASFSGPVASGPAGSAVGEDGAALLPVPPTAGWEPVLTIKPRRIAFAPQPRRTSPSRGKAIGDTVLIVGSFADKANAHRAAATWRDLDAVVVPARVRGRLFFRVVAGPYEETGVAGRKAALNARGVTDAWAARLCTSRPARPDCVALPRSGRI